MLLLSRTSDGDADGETDLGGEPEGRRREDYDRCEPWSRTGSAWLSCPAHRLRPTGERIQLPRIRVEDRGHRALHLGRADAWAWIVRAAGGCAGAGSRSRSGNASPDVYRASPDVE